MEWKADSTTFTDTKKASAFVLGRNNCSHVLRLMYSELNVFTARSKNAVQLLQLLKDNEIVFNIINLD